MQSALFRARDIEEEEDDFMEGVEEGGPAQDRGDSLLHDRGDSLLDEPGICGGRGGVGGGRHKIEEILC